MERNIARMAEHARRHGIALGRTRRPTNPSEIARRQMEAGALGICSAKLGEAEALADAGVEFHPDHFAGGDRSRHRAAYGAECRNAQN